MIELVKPERGTERYLIALEADQKIWLLSNDVNLYCRRNYNVYPVIYEYMRSKI